MLCERLQEKHNSSFTNQVTTARTSTSSFSESVLTHRPLSIGHYRVNDLLVILARHHVSHPLYDQRSRVAADRPRRRLAVRQRHKSIIAAVHDETGQGQGAQTMSAVGLRYHGIQLAGVGGRLEWVAMDGLRHVLGGVGAKGSGVTY